MTLVERIGGVNEAERALYYAALGATHVGKPEGAQDFVYYQMNDGFLCAEALAQREPWPEKTTASDLVNHHKWNIMHGRSGVPDEAISLRDLLQELMPK